MLQKHLEINFKNYSIKKNLKHKQFMTMKNQKRKNMKKILKFNKFNNKDKHNKSL